MGTLSNFLGMQIDQLQDGIFACQRVYTEKVLERFKMHEENPVATLCDRSSGGTEVSVRSYVSYREAVGCLMYLMMVTRPYIGWFGQNIHVQQNYSIQFKVLQL